MCFALSQGLGTRAKHQKKGWNLGLNVFKMMRVVGNTDLRFAFVVLLLLRKNNSRYLSLMTHIFCKLILCVCGFVLFWK